MVARVVCKNCHAEVPGADVNVGEGVAYCRACGTLTRLKELAAGEEADPSLTADPDAPPRGCEIVDDGVETRIRASARSLGTAAGLLFFAIFWNSIVSVFVIIALGGTWHHLFGPLPSWFPTPWGQGGNPGPGMPLGMLIFLWIFLTPFIFVGLTLIIGILVSLFGHVEVRLRGDEGVAITRFGPFFRRRLFDAREVRLVRTGPTKWQRDGKSRDLIIIELRSGDTIRFGSQLPEERCAWMAAALRTLLAAG